MDEKNIAVKVVNGNLTIEGKKQEEKEEKKKDYYLHERLFGSFERSFQVPEGVDADKIEERGTHGSTSEEARSAEAGEEDRREGSVNAFGWLG